MIVNDERWRNVKPVRTTSGGRAALAALTIEGGSGRDKVPPSESEEEEALPAALQGRGGRTDDDAARRGAGTAPTNESGKRRSGVEEEAPSAAPLGARRGN